MCTAKTNSPRRIKSRFVFLAVLPGLIVAFAPIGLSQESRPAARWTLDAVSEGTVVLDSAADISDALAGNYRAVKGVAGQAIKFDGYTTSVARKPENAPDLPSAFTLEAWVALAAYPWSWCPVIAHTQENAGYALEIGPAGELVIRVYSGSLWRMCVSRSNLSINNWAHVAGVFDPDSGLAVYINGQEQGRLEFKGNMVIPRRSELLIGSVPQPTEPSYIHRTHGTLPGWFSLDAILDEVTIHGRALSAGQLAENYAALRSDTSPDIPPRILPSGPPGPGTFGAYYTHLKYYWEWDDLWRIADHPDVVVQFDDSPVRVVFWRGTRYSPAWVTENNLWMADQSVEAWNDEEGCFEHMQDRHCRYSHVRIIENTPARVVVHWRYAPTSAYDSHWNVNPRTGWGCWVDEYYYFYPDQTGIRKYSWEAGSLGRPRQFQESIPLTGPGQTQGDVVNVEYVTIGNLLGATQTFSYIQNPPRKTEKTIPKGPMIQQHNLKSDNKPFIIFEPGGEMHYLRDMNIEALSRSGSCSHWPIGQMRCDGRTQRTPDRAASFLGFPITDPVIHDDGNRRWISSLYGMNDLPFDHLVPLAKSWIRAPELRVASGEVRSLGYDFSQRAYVLAAQESAGTEAELVLEAGPESPLRNACLVIKGWGDGPTRVSIRGDAELETGDHRLGRIRTLEGTDLLVWIAAEAGARVTITLSGE